MFTSAHALSLPLLQPAQRMSVSLNAEMSKSIPFLFKPEKLDGSMVGDMGFDPIGLSEIQVDLKYARWAELKHGRIAMLAIACMVWQEYLPHVPGAAYATTDPLAAPAAVGWGPNLQIFLFISILKLASFNKYYDDSVEPRGLGYDLGSHARQNGCRRH
jgi:hypothetical protein